MNAVVVLVGNQTLQRAAALTLDLLSRAGRSVRATHDVSEVLQGDESVNTWVLSLSSGLSESETVRPDVSAAEGWAPAAVAVMDADGLISEALFGPSGVMVLRRDIPDVAALEPAVPAPGRTPRGTPKTAPRAVVRFGLDAPTQPGDFGLVIESGMRWLVRALPAEEGVRRRKDEVEELHLQRLMPAQALPTKGDDLAEQEREWVSALAALALGTVLGCPLAPMLHALREQRSVSNVAVSAVGEDLTA